MAPAQLEFILWLYLGLQFYWKPQEKVAERPELFPFAMLLFIGEYCSFS
jgi:hypothetical protein